MTELEGQSISCLADVFLFSFRITGGLIAIQLSDAGEFGPSCKTEINDKSGK